MKGFTTSSTGAASFSARLLKSNALANPDAEEIAEKPLSFAAADLAPPPSVGDPDNLLKATTKGQPVVVTVPWDPDTETEIGDSVVLFIDAIAVESTRVYFTAYAPVQLTIPPEYHARDGGHAIRYQLRFDTGQNNILNGPPGQFFTVDYTAPGNPDIAPPEFPFDIGTGLTPDKLEADGTLKTHVYGYSGIAVDDAIWGSIDGVATDVGRVDHIPVPGEPINIFYPAAAIGALDDAEHSFGYYVIDRAGNKSPESAVVKMPALLEGYIDDLAAPLVPEADDGLVDDDDARTDGVVIVQVPANPELDTSYSVVIYWGDFASTPMPVPAGGQDPVVSLGIPYGVVYALWYAAAAGADLEVPVAVRYEVFRNKLLAGKSPVTDVVVNLALAGGEDPNPETPVNEKLQPPTVVSASGEVDHIPIGDFAQDGSVSIPFTTVGEIPSKPVFLEGDDIEVTYDSAPPFSYTVQDTDIDAAVAIKIPLAGTVIDAGGLGVIPVSYTVTRNLAGGGKNVALSPTKNITVNGPGDLPGDGKPLPAPYWLESERPPAPKDDLIGKDQARPGVTIVLPLYLNKKVGDILTVSLELFSGFGHTDGEASIDPPRTASHTINVGPADVGQESQVKFTYDELMYFGKRPLTMHAHIGFSAKRIDGGDEDKGVSSEGLVLRVDCRGEE